MKNFLLFSTILLAFSSMTLFSCANDSASSTAMQEPKTEDATIKATQDGTNKLSVSEAQTATVKNLQDALKGETTASAKYAAYSKAAAAEGFPQIALLFKAASTSENIHANNHKAVLQEMGIAIADIKPEFVVKTSRENLMDAIAGESYEISTMYPEFLQTAEIANNQLALISMNYAYKTEQKHKVMYEKALKAIDGKQTASLPSEYSVCPTCGNTYDAQAPKRCGISMTSGERFIKIIGA